MKKTKRLLIALVLVIVTALTVSLLAACDGCKKNKTPEPGPEPEPEGPTLTSTTYQSIEIDTTDVKKEFIVGETFTSEGLKVYANFLLAYDDGTETPEKRDVTADAMVISSSFNSSVADDYTIEVSYIYDLEYKATSYTVTVVETRYGVDVILLEDAISGLTLSEDKTSGEYELDSEHSTVTIDTSKIEVRIPNERGVVDYTSAALATSEYSVKVFKNATEEVTELTGLGAGAYEIWVYLPEEEGTNYVRKNFVQLKVVDSPISLTFNANAEGTVTSQAVSNTDSMSATWKFTATYASGATEPLTADDVKITLDTKTAGENKQAAVSYTFKNAIGNEITVSTTVPYTITSAAGAKIDQSFVVVNKDDAATALATVAAGGTVEDNSLFKITTVDALEYAVIDNATRITEATLLDGSTVDFNKALRQTNATNPDGTTKAPAIEFEAKAEITLKVYIALANNSYNSHRKGTFDITIYNADGTVKSTDTSKTQGNRNVLTNLSFDLAEGEKVAVSATYTDSDNTKNFKLWLFGAEAAGVGGGGSSEKLSESIVVVNKEDAATALATVEADGTVEDNSLFKVTTEDKLVYAEISNATRVTAATLLDGSSVDFNKALRQDGNTTPDGTTKAPAIEFEAKADITLKVYITICNGSYNSHRKGTFNITIYNADGTVKSTDTSKTQGNRDALTNLTFNLSEGEKVAVSATYTDSDNTKNFKLWFFGAEAETL